MRLYYKCMYDYISVINFLPPPQSSLSPSTPSLLLSPSQLSSGIASWGSSPSPSTMPSKPLNSTWSSSMMEQKGVGRSVSLAAISEGWAMKYQDKQKYIMQFNTHDRNHTGYLTGAEVRPLLTKSDLDKSILAKIW